MTKDCIFTPADILLPANNFEKWSVIACDQFSSQPEYWERVQSFVGNSPSTLNMIIPEAFLEHTDEEGSIGKIREAMESYLKSGVLSEVKDSFIYVERMQSDGHVRKGLVGTIDLEDYEFSGKQAAIKASEGTILGRLPVRIKIRKAALMELGHIIAFINDRANTVIEPLSGITDTLDKLYDFGLMEGGGHIKGYKVTGDKAVNVMNALQSLQSGKDKTLMIIGDGNHSLAGAKVYWDEIKTELSGAERENHPARKALVEICNVYDPAIGFEAIHRVLFNIDANDFIKRFESRIPCGDDYVLKWNSKEGSGEVGVKAACIGDMLVLVQEFIDDYIEKHPGSSVDYVHGAKDTEELGRKERNLGLVLPAMDKSEFFDTVEIRGVFPRKSFSVGHAKDKRYYLECRAINRVPYSR